MVKGWRLDPAWVAHYDRRQKERMERYLERYLERLRLDREIAKLEFDNLRAGSVVRISKPGASWLR